MTAKKKSSRNLLHKHGDIVVCLRLFNGLAQQIAEAIHPDGSSPPGEGEHFDALFGGGHEAKGLRRGRIVGRFCLFLQGGHVAGVQHLDVANLTLRYHIVDNDDDDNNK